VAVVRTDILGEHITYIRVERVSELGTVSQSKILRVITNVPRYVTNQTLHDDLKVPFIKDVIQEKSINHHNKLGNHSNPILQSLLEQHQRRRLKKLWPADLIDG
jgi:hypothetical protein